MTLKEIFQRIGKAPAEQTREELLFARKHPDMHVDLLKMRDDLDQISDSEKMKVIEKYLISFYVKAIKKDQEEYDNLTVEEKVYRKLDNPNYPPFWVNPQGGLYMITHAGVNFADMVKEDANFLIAPMSRQNLEDLLNSDIEDIMGLLFRNHKRPIRVYIGDDQENAVDNFMINLRSAIKQNLWEHATEEEKVYMTIRWGI